MDYQLYSDDEELDVNERDDERVFNTGRSSVIFAIDCSQENLQQTPDGNEGSYLNQVIESIHDMYLNKIIVSNKDLQGVVLFGTEKKRNSSDFDNIYTLLDLSMPSIASITKLKEMKEMSCETFTDEFGLKPDHRISDVLWECLNMFSNCKHKLASRSVVLFTWESNPHENDPNAALRAKAKAGDLHDHKVELQVFSFNPEFSYDHFYKEIVSNPESLDGVVDPLGGVVNLYSFLVRECDKQRPVKRVPLRLGKLQISVGIYSPLRRAVKSSSVNIDQKTNAQVVQRRRLVDARTGDILLPSDIKYLQKWGGADVVFEKEEVENLKSLGESGIEILGFKPISKAVKRWYHVHPAQFIYPDEDQVKGSRTFFKALLKKCHSKQVVAICRFASSIRSAPRLVCLMPQMEEVDAESFLQTKSPGFHLIYLPFSDDIRHLEIVRGRKEVNEEAVEAAQVFIHKMRFTYEPECFDDPALQTHYKNLEAMALELPAPEPITDFTKPDHARIERKAGEFLEQFKSLVFTPDYCAQATAKRPGTSGASGGSKVKKIKDTTEIDLEDYVKNNKLASLTVAGLKEICARIGVKAPSRKADIIGRIEKHVLSSSS